MEELFYEFYIPHYMREGIELYIKHRVPPGSFLRAVLENDFMGACRQADDTNLRNLPAYAEYLYNKAPQACYGSQENVRLWLIGEM